MSSSMQESFVPMEVQVTQCWGGNAIAQKHTTEGVVSFAVGEQDVEIAHWEGGQLVVTPPTGATVWVNRLMQMPERFILAAGQSADVVVGDFTFQLKVGEREARPARNVAAAVLEDAGLRTFAGSGVAHALLLASVAFFMPSLSQADDETLDRDRIINLKAYLDSSAEREQEQKPAQDVAGGSSSDSGQPAKGESGSMGQDKPVPTPGHWTLRGDAKPEDVQLSRDRALKEAAEFGMIGLISTSMQADPNAPIVTWGNLSLGADKDSHMGNLWLDNAGDAFGTGLGLSGVGSGGGGLGEGIGSGGIGTIGHACLTTDNCFGPGGPGGYGTSSGRLAPTHVVRSPHIDWKGEVTTNGRLDPSVIQRIVRLNSGRFVGCYQDGLRSNPSLEGRVDVAFMIGRDGTVTASQDTAGSDLPDSNVRACVVRSFYNLEFPEPKGGTVRVNYPFSFTPQ